MRKLLATILSASLLSCGVYDTVEPSAVLSSGEITKAVYFTEYDNGNSGAAATIDWAANGPYQYITLTANTTLTFTDPAGAAGLHLTLAQDGTGSRTVTWDGDVKWAGGTAPTLTTTLTTGRDTISCAYIVTDTKYHCTSVLDLQ